MFPHNFVILSLLSSPPLIFNLSQISDLQILVMLCVAQKITKMEGLLYVLAISETSSHI